jgi:hypothetical protein
LSTSDPTADSEPIIGVLRNHKLRHLPLLRVGESIRSAKMLRACDSTRCPSTCCATGVWADKAEAARILEHVDVIHAAMDPGMERDPARWFDVERPDADFPSGIAVGTRATAGGCVFLNGAGRCVLQKAHADGLVPVTLKPFYCFAFPITIDKGTLSMDIDGVDGSTACCRPSPGGERSVMDVFAWELEHVLGAEGVRELQSLLGVPSPP